LASIKLDGVQLAGIETYRSTICRRTLLFTNVLFVGVHYCLQS